jgi:hypothetical protein
MANVQGLINMAWYSFVHLKQQAFIEFLVAEKE